MDLTNRQIQILKCIVEEYSETAQAVGSDTLDRKYNLGISPATIRNEMVALTKNGFLVQPHTSAGRIPSPMAIKFYIHQLMKEKELSVAEEVAIKERLWDTRDELDQLLRETTRTLSEYTGMLSVATTDDQRLYHAGSARMLELPEFFNIDVTRQVLSLIEEVGSLSRLFEQAHGEEPIHVLLGEEMGGEELQPLGMVFVDYQALNHHGRLAVIGPARLDYGATIPRLRYLKQLFDELSRG